jgi:hypothetical protein
MAPALRQVVDCCQLAKFAGPEAAAAAAAVGVTHCCAASSTACYLQQHQHWQGWVLLPCQLQQQG